MTTSNMKIVIVGDPSVGKTCMCFSYANNQFPDEFVPTVFDNNAGGYGEYYDGKKILFSLWDTAGQSEYDTLRPLSYPDTDIFLICFSLVDPKSLSSVKSKWFPEVREFSPGTPILLVGTKLDLREDPKILREMNENDERPVYRSEGKKFSESKLRLRDGYRECSAKTQKGLRDVFKRAVEYVFEEKDEDFGRRGPGARCVIL